jgi:nucleoside-diphosphate-sugar epimerase
MTTLLCFGLGYCARRYVADFGRSYAHVAGTVRCLEDIPGAQPEQVARFAFDGTGVSAALMSALRGAYRLLISVPPAAQGDPVLASLSDELRQLPQLEAIVYLSSIGVYGDHAGAEVDETTAPQPTASRGHARLAAERAWQELGAGIGKPTAILRLAGIYGPGRNTLVRLAEGRAQRIVKPGQVFNRIHVADVAQAIDAAFTRRANGVFNVADDEPSPPEDVIVYGAKLIGIEPPPAIPFAEAEPLMPPMARSFYASSSRVRNDRLRHDLGVSLMYPTYRDGLRALRSSASSL